MSNGTVVSFQGLPPGRHPAVLGMNDGFLGDNEGYLSVGYLTE